MADAFVKRAYEASITTMRALAYRDRGWCHHRALLEGESPRIKPMVARSRTLGLS